MVTVIIKTISMPECLLKMRLSGLRENSQRLIKKYKMFEGIRNYFIICCHHRQRVKEQILFSAAQLFLLILWL